MMISAALLTSAATAHAEDAKPADTAMAAMHMDKASFVKSVGGASAFEIGSSKLALEKSQSDDVKTFAQQMVDDHTKAGEKLTAILKDEGSPPPEMTFAPKQADAMKLLEAAKGADFDAAYISLQTGAHMEAVALFRTYAGKPDDQKVGGFAKETLPTLEMHLDHVKMLAAAH
jgi:putative membrane protein